MFAYKVSRCRSYHLLVERQPSTKFVDLVIWTPRDKFLMHSPTPHLSPVFRQWRKRLNDKKGSHITMRGQASLNQAFSAS